MSVEPGKTYIGKVRARSSESDTLAFQLRLGSTLSATNLHPPGLPASAILCIRKLRDPLPGALHLQHSGMRPPHAWEQAVSAALQQLVDQAARPARGSVPPDAEAVIFADRAEMLACLASDWCEGNMFARWWWQSLLRGKDRGQWLIPTWLDTPEYIPVALHNLAIQGKAIPFVGMLHESDVHTMVRGIMRCFGLYELQYVYETVAKEPVQLERVQNSPQQSSTSAPTAKHQHEIQEPESSAELRSTSWALPTQQNQPVQQSRYQVAPWQSWVPEISSANKLSRERQTLLGVGLMLVRAPSIVRTSSFGHAVLQWWPAVHIFPSIGTSSAGNHPGVEDGLGQHSQSTQSSAEQLLLSRDTSSAGNRADLGDGWGQHFQFSNADIAERPDKVPELAEREGDTRKEFAGISDDIANANRYNETVQQPVSESVELVQEVFQITAAEPADAPLHPAQISPSVPGEATFAVPPFSALDALVPPINQKQPGTVELIEAQIETKLGGLFYLINLALFLNLYGDFTTPLQPGLSLSIWDFITLLGQQLPGPAAKIDDPIWSFLAKLAGRSELEPPGKDFNPPQSWRIPAEWLTPFPEEGTWRWNVKNERLQVLHPAQFLVFDLPLENSDPMGALPAGVLVREIQALGKEVPQIFHTQEVPLRDGEVSLARGLVDTDDVVLVGNLSPQIERWLRWLMPYVRLRLQRALGLANPEDVPRTLCEHPGHISLTATHLDIVFSLAELPIEVRLSGLDRNPGWVPAAGHFIAFHFD